MARFSIYLSDEELVWVKSREAGWLRTLVQKAMAHPVTRSTERNEPVQITPRAVDAIAGVKECPRCKTLIPEKAAMHGKCGWKEES